MFFEQETTKHKQVEEVPQTSKEKLPTLRGTTEEVFRANEEKKYQELLENAEDAIILFDIAGNVQKVNTKAIELFGYNKEEFTRLCYTDLHSSEALTRMLFGSGKAGLDQILHTGFGFFDDVEILNKKKIPVHADIAWSIIPYTGKTIIQGIFRDITERKRFEEGLKLSEERYRSIVEDQTEFVVRLKPDTTIIFAGNTFCRFLDVKKEAIIGQKLVKMLPRKERAPFIDNLARLTPANPIYMREKPAASSKKERRWIQWINRAIFDKDNRLIAIQSTGRDITENKLAHEALRDSEAKFKTITESSLAAVYIIRDNRFCYINPKFTEIFQYTGEEIQKVHVRDLIHPEDWPAVRRNLSEWIKGKTAKHGEIFRNVRKDGAIIYVEAYSGCIMYKGRPAVLGTILDVTDRIEAEKRQKETEVHVRKSESKYRTIFENSGSAMAMTDESDTLLLVNSTFEKLSGYTAKEIGEQHIKLSVLLRESSEDRHKLLTRNGKLVDVIVTRAPIGNSGKMVFAIIDISRLLHMENMIRQSQEIHQALIEQSSDGIFTIDPKTRKVLEANEQFSNILGYAPEDVTSLTVYDLMQETAASIQSALNRVMSRGRSFLGERTFRGSGKLVDVDVAMSRVSFGNKTFIMGSFRDISEKKQIEQAFQQAQKMEAVGALAGGIAHDFNNILQVVAGYSYQLQERFVKGSPQARQAGLILKAAEQGAQLTRSILGFSRKQAIDLKTIDINAAIKNTERFLRRVIGENVELEVTYCPDNAYISADQTQIEQILMNMATNARDAMPQGGSLRISARVVEADDQFRQKYPFIGPGAYIMISVSDTGTGMDEETKRRVFEPFFTTKQIGKGTGLGMAMVYGIVKQHHGFIMIDSEIGVGTTVSLYFPIVIVANRDKNDIKEGEEQPAVGGDETLLIVEDEAEVRRFVSDILTDYGYTVIGAVDGEQAIERFASFKNQISLVVLDVIMPKKSGKEVYDQIKAIKPQLKALFMSGYNEEVINKEGILQTGVPLLTKPVFPTTLLKKIRSVLDGQ